MYFYSWYNVPVMLKNTKFLKSSFLCSILNEYSEDPYYEEPCYSNCLLGERNSWELPLYLQASLKLTSWGGGQVANAVTFGVRSALFFWQCFHLNSSYSCLSVFLFCFALHWGGVAVHRNIFPRGACESVRGGWRLRCAGAAFWPRAGHSGAAHGADRPLRAPQCAMHCPPPPAHCLRAPWLALHGRSLLRFIGQQYVGWLFCMFFPVAMNSFSSRQCRFFCNVMHARFFLQFFPAIFELFVKGGKVFGTSLFAFPPVQGYLGLATQKGPANLRD